MNDLSFSRRQAIGALSAGVATVALPGCARALAAAPRLSGDAEVAALLESIAENLLGLHPETATELGIDVGARAALRSQLRDRSEAGQQRIAQTLRADLARIQPVDTVALTHATRTSVEVVRSAFTLALEGFSLPYGDVPVAWNSWRKTPYVVIQNVGAYLDIPRFLDSGHRIANAGDAEAYLARLEDFPVQLDGELGRLKATAAQGVIAPAFLIDRAVSQMTLSIKGAREGGGLVDSIARRTRDIPGNWAERARAIAQQKVGPALERQLAELQSQRGRATDDAGMWARPYGDEYYRWALKASTTTSMGPEEVHQLGVDMLRGLHAQMDSILKSLGYSQGSVGQRMQALARDPRYTFPQNEEGRGQIMAFIQERISRIRAKMPQAFNTLARGNVEVRRLPPEEEPGAPGAYGESGSIDGTVPGKFWINLKQGHDHTRYNLPSLTHHEAIPGHVWESEYTNKLPLIRTLLSFNAYSEGWGLYAEQLADELGVYEGDPAGRLGYLDSMAFRATRLVVDTGLHAKRWTRQQARDFFRQALGDPNESEVDRYCSWPGQACGYKIGHAEIVRQRARAQQALRARYDLRDFNDTVVKGGNVPLDVLAKNVDEYIATAARSAAA